MRILALLTVFLSFMLVFSQEDKSKHPMQYEEVIEGMDFEDVKLLLKTALDGRNMNVLGVVDVATEKPRFSYFLVCNLSYAEKIFRELPQLGVMAPCRIYLYEREDGTVVVGFINVETLLKLFGDKLSDKSKELFLKADSDIKSSIREVRGE